METIIYGHKYLCKKSITNGCVCYYTKGKVYESKLATNALFGFISDNVNDRHAWPNEPEQNAICNDKWTDYFIDLG